MQGTTTTGRQATVINTTSTWVLLIADGSPARRVRVVAAMAAALASMQALPVTVLSTTASLTHISLGEPLPVLEATPSGLLATMRAALSAKLTVVAVPDYGPDNSDYPAFSGIVGDLDSPRLQYLGAALGGPTQLLRKLAGGFKPLT